MVQESFKDNAEIKLVPPMERFVKDWNKTEIPVEIKGMYIRHIADVDTIDQSFKIAIGYDMMWPATKEDINSWKANDVEFQPTFIPNFEFPNAKEETMERRALVNGNPFTIQEVDGKHFNFLRTLVYLNCVERLELHSFPFDVQELSVTLDMSFAPVEKAMFVPGRGAFPKPDENELATGVSESILSSADFKVPLVTLNRQYCTVPDFDIERCVVQFKSACYGGEEYMGEDAFRWSQVTMRIQLKRKAAGYLYRIGLYNLLLAYASVCAFAMNPVDDLGDRIGFLITLILSSVAFQYIVAQYLPNVSYMTVLDQYTFLVFFLICVLMGVVSYIGSASMTEERRVELDRVCLYTYIISLTILQVFFCIYGLIRRRIMMTHLQMGELELYKLNYNPAVDSVINVTKSGLLKESTKPMKLSDTSAFVSFAGSVEDS